MGMIEILLSQFHYGSILIVIPEIQKDKIV